MNFSDPGQIEQHKLMDAHKEFDKTDTGMKMLPPMFFVQYTNGWNYARDHGLQHAFQPLPEDLLKHIAQQQPLLMLPVEGNDVVAAFKMGYEDCLKAGKPQ